jgi:thioredoxin reductase (NADPH)
MPHTQLAIIGSGPAGYTAALYAARAQLQPVLFTGLLSGGQLMWTGDIENYPGFPQGVGGPALMDLLRQQAVRFGTDVKDIMVDSVELKASPFTLTTADETWTADAVIVATGASSVAMNVPGESEFMGRGVSVCAVCDAAFYRDKTTFVVGGGDSAMEDTLALTKFAKSVTVLHRRDAFRASKIMQERVLNHPKVTVRWNTTIKEVLGKDVVTAIKVVGPKGEEELSADGVFVAIGHSPTTSLFKGILELDEHGYLITRQSPSRAGVERAQGALSEAGLLEFPTMTSVPGVFAAGDVVDLRYRQAITSAGQGCAAALDAERWIEGKVAKGA